MVLAVQTLLLHPMSLASLVAVCTALAVVGIVAGAPESGAADGERGAAAGGDAADEGSADATRDGGDDGGQADGDRRAAGDDVDDDDEDVDHDLPDEIRNDPKRLRTHLRRTQRQFGRVRPIAERFRDPATGQFMQPQQIDRILGRAQDMEELEGLFNQHPDIVQTIIERRRGGARTAAAVEDAFTDPFANEDDLPWDTKSPEGKKFLELFREGARDRHELKATIRRLEARLGQVDQRDQHRTLAQVEQTWKTATLAEAQKVPADYREAFVTSVWRAFELAKRSGALGKMRVQQILERELRPYVRATRGAQRQGAAGAQRSAEHNTTIARPGSRATTSAANPKESNAVGTIKDARKSFFDRIGKRG